MTLLRKEEEAPFASTRLALLAPILLSLGMTTLFLDLEHKLFVFRFYTSFQITSPMSWGAWILVIIYPVSIMQILSTLRPGFPTIGAFVDKISLGRQILDLCERHRRQIALAAIPFAIVLGIYTGILLSAFGAFFDMFALNGLPRYHHPVFYSRKFEGASTDKYFIFIGADDPKFDTGATKALLESLDGSEVESLEVEG